MYGGTGLQEGPVSFGNAKSEFLLQCQSACLIRNSVDSKDFYLALLFKIKREVRVHQFLQAKTFETIERTNWQNTTWQSSNIWSSQWKAFCVESYFSQKDQTMLSKRYKRKHQNDSDICVHWGDLFCVNFTWVTWYEQKNCVNNAWIHIFFNWAAAE